MPETQTGKLGLNTAIQWEKLVGPKQVDFQDIYSI